MLRIIIATLMTLGAVATVATAQSTASGDPQSGEGHVVLECTVDTSGRLNDCAVASEDPVGKGFGEAALKLSKSMRFHAPSGAPNKGRAKLRVPVTFKLAPEGGKGGSVRSTPVNIAP